MSGENNQTIALKYFIFKFNEIIKNSYKSLQNIRCDSLRGMLQESLIIMDEMNKNLGDDTRLNKSLESQFKSIIFWYNNNPLYEHKILKKPMKLLVAKLPSTTTKNGMSEIYNAMSSLLKTTIKPASMVALHIDVLLAKEQLNFADVDALLDSLINELIYEGYSLKYLADWYSNNVFKGEEIKILDDTNIKAIIEKIKNLTSNAKRHELILNAWISEEMRRDFENGVAYNHGTQLELLNEGQLSALNSSATIFSFQNGFGALKLAVSATDKYKAIEIAKKNLERYIEVYRQLHGREDKDVTGKFALVLQDDCSWKNERVDIDDMLLFKNLGEREKEDVKDFIVLRNRINKEGVKSPDIHILERAMFLVNTSSGLAAEHGLLNLWSALEYLVASYNNGSIIGRVIDIIPRVLCLYYIKDKMNVLWEKLMRLRTYIKIAEVKAELEKMHTLCSYATADGKDKYYKEKFAQYLVSADAKEMYKILDNNIVIQRDLAELNKLLTKRESLSKQLLIINEAIIHDLTKIYRVRNKLVHSGNNIPENFDVCIGKLHRYINCLIGTIIYYSSKTPEITIAEILSSIIQTHEDYLKTISEATDLKNITSELVAPPYIFL